MYLEAAGKVRLDTEKCLNRLYRGIECRTCVEQCPAKALSFENGKIALATDTCVGCGQCLTHCPTGVFRMDSWQEATLVKEALASEADTIVLFCGGHPSAYRKSKTQTYECLKVPHCLAGISKAALFEIAAHKKVELMVDACEECEYASCLALIRNQVQQTGEMLCACTGSSHLSLVEARSQEEKGRKQKAVFTGEKACSRREFLFRLADVSLKTVSTEYEAAATQVEKQEALAAKAAARGTSINGVRMGRRMAYRPQWTEHLKQVYHRAYVDAGEHGEAAIWPSVRIQKDCTNCNMCASFCPTGALRIDAEEKKDEAGRVTLSAVHYFQPMLCADCRLCASVCPIQAIVRDREPNDQPFATHILCRGAAVPCKKCGALTYHVSTGICHWCKKDSGIEDIKQAVRIRLGKKNSKSE